MNGEKDELDFLKALVPKFGDSRVRMKDPADVRRKVQSIVEGGLSNLQIIADFDYTMSRFHKDGKQALNCFSVVQEYHKFPEEYRQKFVELRAKYYPIEICHEMSVEEKIPFMIEWYLKGQDLYIEAGLTMDLIKEMVESAHVELRCETHEMMAYLRENNVPMLVFSAGMGDVIEEILRVQGQLSPNVHVISNRFKFDEKTGKVVGLKGELIHVYNKNESAAVHSSYFEDLTHRHNVVLMGDSTGDSHMADGVVKPNAVLKIGFLNDKLDERLPVFLKHFDVVLLDDQTMELPHQIIRASGAAGKK
jgi:5'-nucleotidase